MGNVIQRPRFFEGQVLGAADLSAGLDYARSQEARHDRLVHQWGIVDGLALVATPQTSAGGNSVLVTLSTGLALDGTGREIVVAAEATLDEKVFVRSNVAIGDAAALYPVLLAGADTPALPTPVSHSCTTPQASRTVESYKLSFGAPGDEARLDEQAVPRVDEGAGGAPGQPRWWIVVGFVTWDATQRRFTSVAESSNGVGRRYVGVRADEVVAQGGTLTLRSRRAATANAPIVTVAQTPTGGSLTFGVDDGHGGVIPRFVESSDGTIESDAGQLTLRSGGANVVGKPIVRLDEAPAGGTLTFGLQDAGGQPSNLLTVDPHGNLTIAGFFNGLVAGAVRVASGVATHGIVLPLPDGITEEQVANGEATLHVQLTPHPPGLTPYDADVANYPNWIGTAISAAVDVDRRVQCLVQWAGFRSAGGPAIFEVLSGACDYVVLAVVNGGAA